MNKIILYNDEEGTEFVCLCTNQEYYDELVKDIKIIDEIDVEQDLTSWPTDRPLSADF